MKRLGMSHVRAAAVVLWAVVAVAMRAQSGFDDDRVMLQGFYWESYRHGHPEKFPDRGPDHWYRIVERLAPEIRAGRFDLIWLPPPFQAGVHSAGYNPKEYFNFANSYGTAAEHRAMLEALLRAGVEPVADLVFNHRDGTNRWADFRNPAWGPWAITRGDEAFTNRDSELFGTPEAERGGAEETPGYLGGQGTTYAYASFRDLDHGNLAVRRDLVRAMRSLQSLGYRGWRYDMVHGFSARWVALYNRATRPTFSVGEYDWGSHALQRGWIWDTATEPSAGGADHLRTASHVFDFTTQFSLKDNKGNPRAWCGYGFGVGMVGDTTDGLPWKQRAVTFLENHDTGYRTNEDDTPQSHHESDSFANNWEVEQAYAYILTHPGVPCVYWKHYFDWGAELQAKIRALVNARKAAGVRSGSAVHHQQNALAAGVYAARVEGTRGVLYVRIGGSDADWEPGRSGYQGFRDYAHGAGWRVWLALPGDPALVQAPLPAALPVPVFVPPEAITVDDREL